jgi:TPP-dependent pyruvate/acetoin dehydrogenase alpha subunit
MTPEAALERIQKLVDENVSLQAKLSQLQSKMEARERKAFEAARESRPTPHGFIGKVYKDAEDYLKSTTPSTESGNLNTK